MENPQQNTQKQSQLDIEVDKLKHDLETHKVFNQIMISSLVAGLNEVSEKRNAYEVLTSVIEGFKSEAGGKNVHIDEAIIEALRMLKK
ncbi:hypothetical protein [Pantoea sp. OXWO6B1]|uniref:hypothetical protein n=1 Tax=Pantoea sp. OXWO6B1 TaxID=1835724 RepID=UPI0007C70D59|nr:hypothetical protein [Pantoea sp. OXWO6B1]OAD97989.1 hypothetical protein A6A26_23835 [Pantoea sp. OXWO6B1]